MVVLARNAAAGREFLYTFPSFSGQSDFVFQKSFICVTLVSQNPPVLLPRKSVCCHTLPHRRVCRQPLSRVSRKQRYNTLDFASKIVCQQGCSRPYWKPSGKGMFPLQSLIFLAGAYTNCKRQLVMSAQKMQKEACAGAWHRLPFGRKCRRKGRQFPLHSRSPHGGDEGQRTGKISI